MTTQATREVENQEHANAWPGTGTPAVVTERPTGKDMDALVAFARAGDPEATEQIVTRYSGLVFTIANKLKIRCRNLEIGDLEQEGFVALLEAVAAYEPGSPASFATYAWKKVKWHLLDVTDADYALTVSSNVRRVRCAALRQQAAGKDATPAEIAAHTQLTERLVRRALVATRPALSLDTPLSTSDGDVPDFYEAVGGDIDTNETLAGLRRASVYRPTEEAALVAIEAEERHAAIEAAITQLSEHQQPVARLRLAGLSNGQIAAETGYSTEQVSYAFTRARPKLRVLLADYKPEGTLDYHGIKSRRVTTGLHWQAQIRTGDKHICLGTFGTAEEAACAYDAAAIKYHNGRARLNFPQEASVQQGVKT